MKVTLLAVVTFTAVASFVGAADPECVYRKLRGLSPHWPNPTNCSSYYRCSKNTVRSINCPAGKEYNPRNGKCATAGRGLCKLSLAAPLAESTNVCADEVNGASMPDTSRCNVFYICYNKLAYPQTCDAGSYFNIKSSNCQLDTETECWQNKCVGVQNGIYLGSSESCANYYICADGQAVEQTCPSGSYFDKHACVDDANNAHCWENYCIGKLDGVMVPDDENCAKFYVCSNQKATMRQCPPGTYFDEVRHECVAGTCPDKVTTTTTPPSTGCDCDDGTLNGHLAANKDNCRLYYVCVDGDLVSGDCSEGNYFDKEDMACKIDSTNSCPDSSRPDCVNGETKENVENCNQYYSCQDNTWQETTCPIGTYFEANLSTCVLDSDNICPQCNAETLTEYESEPIVASVKCKATEAARKSDNCWSYLACISGQWTKQTCSAGFYFDGSAGICRRDDLNLCPENRLMLQGLRSRRSVDNVPETDCTLCNNKPNGFKIVKPDDCTAYYTCSNGLAIASTCPSGQWFNDNACIIDVTGECINPCSCGTGNVTHPICSKYYQCTDGVPQVVDCPAGQGFDSTIEKCCADVNCSAAQCATADDGETFPVTGDNTQFYVCIDKMATIRSCPANTAFDAILKICLAQPSSECDQIKCNANNVNVIYPSLNNDNTTFCICLSDGAYLKTCQSGYSFDEELNLCTFTGPCDPQLCVNAVEYSPSVNYDNPDSFCLCRAGQQVSVPCPIGYTFKPSLLLCVIAPQPDPRCCTNFCVGKPDDVAFAALDTDTGFCMCLDEVPVFKNCPENKTFDAILRICLIQPENITCSCNECDSSVCLPDNEYQVYPANNTLDGFCYCKEYCGVYSKCPDGKEFDTDLSLCLVPPGPVVCNATMCDTLSDYQIYEALNGTAGFCFCKDGLPVYKLCPDGKELSIQEGVCLETANITSIYCDSEKCSCLPNSGSFPSSNEADDTSFCYCLDGEALYKNCHNGTVYDATLGNCIPREVSSCVCEAGKCASLPEGLPFPALNTTQGFCSCANGAATFESCPIGKEFDDTLNVCLKKLAAISEHVACDDTECNIRGLLKTFAAKDRPRGFCTCQADGTATYQSCENDHLYDESLSICIVDACDPTQCRSRTQFETFAAKNTTRGFCSCEIVPTYYHCTAGHVFDISLGLCQDELTAIVAGCDPRDCKNRVQNQPFAAKNTTVGFCSCDGKDETVTYHACLSEEFFDRDLGMCLPSVHGIQKRSVEPEEKVRSISLLKKFFQKLV